MITPDQLDDLPLFAAFSADERSEIAAKAADIRLLAGEYLVQEGEEPYFYVVLAGTMEVTKRVGTGEVVLATRERGGFFGETPVLLGATTFANLRAIDACRVMRLEPLDLQALVVRNATFKAEILSAMTERLADIGQRAVARKADAVLIVGRRWDSACRAARTLLARNQVRHEFLTLDDPLASARIGPILAHGERYPLVQLVDGRVLVAPSIRELATAVGLQTSPRSAEYDVIIIGGGPGGLAAAVYGASEGLRTIMIEREAPGGQAGTSSRIENYLGFPTGLSGDDLANRAFEQAKRLGAEIVVTRAVCGIDAPTHGVTLDGNEVLRASALILATGVTWRALAIPGIERFTGVGVYYGAARSEARNTVGKDIFLIGGGNSAGQAAMFFANYARSVTVLVRGNGLAASMSNYLIRQLATKSNISVETHSELVGLRGERHLEAIDVVNRETEIVTTRPTDALFIFIGADAETDWLPPQIARDARGYILTGPNATPWTLRRDPYLLETTAPGIFAVGDVRHASVKRVASAVGEGSMAIAFAHQYLSSVESATSR
jgi:thioredoxin reductase (NADPH)